MTLIRSSRPTPWSAIVFRTQLRKLSIRLFCLAAAMCLLAVVDSARAEVSTPQGILWQVRSERTVVYLAGSVHLQEEETPLPTGYLEAFRKCDRLVFETDIEKMDSPEGGEEMLRAGLLPPGESLDEQLGPKTREALYRFLKERNLPSASVQRLRPWLCALTLAVREMQKTGLNPEGGVDRKLYRLGRREGKMLGGLETLGEQMGLFEQLSPAQEEEFLRQTLEDLKELEAVLTGMMEAWRRGDDQALSVLIRKNFEGFPDLYDKFFARRNHRWADKITEFLGGPDTVMVVIGAGHLVGEGSVAQILALRGFQVKRRQDDLDPR